MSAASAPLAGTAPRLGRAGIAWRVALVFAATVAALFWRRPDQFRAPYIWVEEGAVNLVQYIEHGWAYLFEPVAGYLILPAKLIQLAALTLSLDWYPEIAFALTLLFTAGVVCMLALSPTRLRHPLACALFVLVVPSDSEVFATSLFAFWWGTLLLPPLLWRRDHDHRLWSRVAMVALGGLSSPMVLPLAPLFALQALLVRTRNTIVVAALACATAAVQLYFIKSSGTAGTELPATFSPAVIVQKFFGMFVFWSPSSEAALPWLTTSLGVALIALLALAAATSARRLGWVHLVLAAGLVASILISIVRVPAEIMHPINAGARYFFFPYIFLGWLAIELASLARRVLAVPLALCLAGALQQFVVFGPRGHDHLDWKQEIARCTAATGVYAMTLHKGGNRHDLWHVGIPEGGCRTLRERSLF